MLLKYKFYNLTFHGEKKRDFLSLKITEDKNGEKIVQLTPDMMGHAIMLNIEHLVRKSHGSLRLQDLQAQYLQVYRNELNPEDFGVTSIEALLLTMADKLDVSR